MLALDLVVGRNVTVGGAGHKRVQNNALGWNLTCQDNAAPITGGPNTHARP